MEKTRIKKVGVAISGGVDSTMAAWLLARDGYKVAGFHMRLYDGEGAAETDGAEQSARACCDFLEIDFKLLDFREQFKREVVAPFAEKYVGGLTPNPCVTCNKRIKFGLLLDAVVAQGADAVATGHYMIKKREGARWHLYRGRDRRKDQSYFLYHLGQATLERTLFPNGEYEKEWIRAKAREIGAPVADRPGSQEICFVGPEGYGRIIEEHFPDAAKPGDIVDRAGHVLGQHKGLIFHTIGQRKGMGIAAPEPLYALELRPEENILVAGTNDELFADGLEFGDASFVSGSPPEKGERVSVKIRYNADPTPATFDGGALLKFDNPQRAVTPGQAVALYSGEEMLGGGTIVKSL